MAIAILSGKIDLRNARRIAVPPGTVFGMLTVDQEIEGKKRNGAGWKRRFLLHCSCGGQREASLEKLRNGDVRSCGCTKIPSMLRHGMSSTRTYKVWAHMKERCTNPTCKAYPGWGGRGISFDKAWMVFENFIADMGEKPPGKSLDRIDNNGDYNRKNCRWATPAEQSRNTRRTITVSLDKVEMCIKDAAKRVNISHSAIRHRAKLLNGTLQDAIDYYAARHC